MRDQEYAMGGYKVASPGSNVVYTLKAQRLVLIPQH